MPVRVLSLICPKVEARDRRSRARFSCARSSTSRRSFGQAARDAGIAISMGSRGDCWDNAVAGELLRDIEEGTHPPPVMANTPRTQLRRLRVHRGVLTTATADTPPSACTPQPTTSSSSTLRAGPQFAVRTAGASARFRLQPVGSAGSGTRCLESRRAGGRDASPSRPEVSKTIFPCW